MEDRSFLSSRRAENRYKTCAAGLPIVDYHNHLSLSDIEANRRFEDPTALWLLPDPYKHRAMRMRGIPERLITGDAAGEEKFAAWCGIFPDLIGNPLYRWSIAELREVFGIEETPSEKNAGMIFEKASAFLRDHEITPAWFIEHFKVEKLCPCLNIWEEIPARDPKETVVPSLRADDALWQDGLKEKASSLEEYLVKLEDRIGHFRLAGCRFADHALDNGFVFHEDDGQNGERFDKTAAGNPLSKKEGAALNSFLLVRLLHLYAKYGMVLQLHLGALRRTSTRLRTLAGAAGGYAAAGNPFDIAALARLFDAAERTGNLPKIVLFPLNAADTARLATLSGSFSGDGQKGLITLGPAWWWNDHRAEIENTLECAAAYGLLSNFIGMTTDSRSFLSLIRHDAFRRILCSRLTRLQEENALLAPESDVQKLIRKICYENASELFKGDD